MNYERVVKIVFYLWGINHILWVFRSLKMLIVGVEIPEHVIEEIIQGKGDPSLFNYSCLTDQIIISIAILILIVLAYRGKEWAYYGIMIFLAYFFMVMLFDFSSLVAGISTAIYAISHPELFLGGYTLFSGISLYILYANKKSEILKRPVNYKKGVEIVFYLWNTIAVVNIIQVVISLYWYSSSWWDWVPEHIIFLFYPNYGLCYVSTLSEMYAILVFLIPIITIFGYKGKKWGKELAEFAYYVFMICMACGFIITLIFGIKGCCVFFDTYHLGLDIISALFPILLFGISFYILYRFKFPTTKLFLIRKPRDQ